MQRSAVSHVLSGRNKPSLDFVLRIKNHFPEISLDWLTMGKGNMLEVEHQVPNAGTQDLFPHKIPVSDSIVGKKQDDVTELSENKQHKKEGQVAKDEEPVYYGVQRTDEKVVRVVFIYDDGTFKELIPR
jgi:hypothetical protein